MSTYYRNTELAARYSVSEATVRNWVKSAKEGKLQLRLVVAGSHVYVAKDISNIPVIEDLVKQNRKYRNTLASKTVVPNDELFEVFSTAQIRDIIRNLELHHEIPVQYSYFGAGVSEWDDYIQKQTLVDAPSMFRRTVELLADNHSYLDKKLERFKKVNLIDIGVGNAMPVKDLIARLIAQGKMGRYVGLDFSDDMLSLAKDRLKGWFGDEIQTEGHQLDIAHQRFADVVAENYLHENQDEINLVLFLGATPNNLRVPSDAFRTICESMNPQDLFIYTDKLEPEGAPPEWFEYEIKYGKSEVIRLLRLVYDLLNIDESFYEIEVGFDAVSNQRYARTRFKVALNISFDFENGKRLISFEKGDAITLWRCWQTTPRSLTELLDSTGFYVLHTSQSQDHNYILTIAEVKRS